MQPRRSVACQDWTSKLVPMRYPALDSLRGLAALVVVFHHYLLVFPSFYPYPAFATGWTGALLYSPLHLFWAGGEAVLFFFVLSGFVLSLTTWEGRPLDMTRFLVRRLWRIWVPMMVAVTLALGAAQLLGTAPVAGSSVWFMEIWRRLDTQAYAEHVLMLGDMDHYGQALIPVTWSLKWEMWGSLLLPLVLLAARQTPLIVGVLGVLSLSWFWQAHAGQTDVLSGLFHYLPMFVLGATLARHRERLATWVACLPERTCWGLLLTALLLIPAQWYGFSAQSEPLRSIGNDLAVLLGAAVLITLALGWPRLQRGLAHPLVRWLGRISFSLYLYHALVLTIVVRLGSSVLPLGLSVVLAFGLTFPVAALAYRWVEQPAMRRGQQTNRRLTTAPDLR